MESEKNNKVVKFEDVRDKLVSIINTKLKTKDIDLDEPVTLVDGFLNEPCSKELSNSLIIGGPTIPMVMLVGDKSGRIYFFALKALLGDVWN